MALSPNDISKSLPPHKNPRLVSAALVHIHLLGGKPIDTHIKRLQVLQ
jgi:hypothetical protein